MWKNLVTQRKYGKDAQLTATVAGSEVGCQSLDLVELGK